MPDLPPAPEPVWERLLAGILRFSGSMMVLAVVPVLMPQAWIAATHAWLGLGHFPQAPIAEYLARSLSAFYVLHGGLFWLISFDLRRYAPILTYVVWTTLACGIGLLILDSALGLPAYWVFSEGPILLTMAGALYGLRRRAGI